MHNLCAQISFSFPLQQLRAGAIRLNYPKMYLHTDKYVCIGDKLGQHTCVCPFRFSQMGPKQAFNKQEFNISFLMYIYYTV